MKISIWLGEHMSNPNRWCAFCIALLCLLFGFGKRDCLAKQFPGASFELQSKMMALEQAAGYDRMTEIVSKPFSPETSDFIFELLKQDNPSVQLACLKLLREIVKQQNIPVDIISKKIKPAIEKFPKRLPATDPKFSSVISEAEDLAWLLDVKSSSDKKNRRALLKQALQQAGSGHRNRRRSAVAVLVEMGEPEDRDILEGQLASLKASKQQALFEEDKRDLTENLEMLKQKRAMLSLDESARPDHIIKLLGEHRKDRASARQTFERWAVDELAKINGQKPQQLLKSMWQDKDYDILIRYRAQEALIRRGDIKSKERTIVFQ
jgi:hypothetical protein